MSRVQIRNVTHRIAMFHNVKYVSHTDSQCYAKNPLCFTFVFFSSIYHVSSCFTMSHTESSSVAMLRKKFIMFYFCFFFKHHFELKNVSNGSSAYFNAIAFLRYVFLSGSRVSPCIHDVISVFSFGCKINCSIKTKCCC